MAARRGIPCSSCVHLFGAGHPSMFALAVAMGCDVFDSAAYALYAKDRRYMAPSGSYRIDELAELPCACQVCRSHTAAELRASPDIVRLLSLHNLAVSLAEISRIRQAITDGVLWELVDERCRGHPQLLQAYRDFLERGKEIEPFDRSSKRRFFYRGGESCLRAEVSAFQHQIRRIATGRNVLVAMDGVKRPGYDTILLFKPPFGPFPPELRETFPIGQSEIPEWDDEMVVQGCLGLLALMDANPESRFSIFTHERWLDIVQKELPGCEVRYDRV